jgi:pimeloyl-ACP methyl ester carboxylesterase
LEQYFLTYKNSAICSYRFGSGDSVVICFHGYGEQALVYSFLEKYAGDQYTFYAFDLPFHGKTEWKEGLDFSLKDLEAIISLMLAHGGHFPGDEIRISLLGFSLGGRAALSFYESRSRQTETMVLLAPDGLKINFWYWLATQTFLGSRLFAFSMKYPAWFFNFLKVLKKARLVNSSVYKFVCYYIDHPPARQELYARWMGLRKLKPSIHKVKNHIRHFKTPVKLLYGKYDRIILPARGKKFQAGIEEHCTISVIDAGHQVLHEKHVKEILAALRQ